MRKILLMAALSAGLTISCKKNERDTNLLEPPKVDTVTSSDKIEEGVQHCYEFVQKKDTIGLTFTKIGDKVNGSLRFKNYEKDSSTGPVSGTFAGDTLRLTYTFASEGSESIREVYFLKDGTNSLLLGGGDMNEKNGKLVFTNPSAVTFMKSMVLVKTECD